MSYLSRSASGLKEDGDGPVEAAGRSLEHTAEHHGAIAEGVTSSRLGHAETIAPVSESRRYPSIDDVRYINSEIGSNGTMLFEGNLDFALDKMRWDEGKGVVRQAAELMHSMIINHPFMEGNKRTAFVTMEVFLNLNGVGIRSEVSIKEIKDLLYGIADGSIDVEKAYKTLESWIS